MRRWLARLVDAEVRRLTEELERARRARSLALRTALNRNTECLLLRARVAELERLLHNEGEAT